MKALVKLAQKTAGTFLMSALLVSVCTPGRAENVEVEEMRKQAENGLAETHGDRNRADLREAIAKQLTPEQTAEAEKRVQEFAAKK
jgi:hypothetical protein